MSNEIITIESAIPVIFGVLKVKWQDDYEAIVDLRSLFQSGTVFDFLNKDSSRFFQCSLDENGHFIFWLDDEGDEIEQGTIQLRVKVEQQAALLAHAS